MAESAGSAWVRLRPGMRVGPQVEDGRGHCVYVQDTASRRMYRFDAQTGGFLRRAYAPDASPVPLSSAIESLTRSGEDPAGGERALTTLQQMGIVEVDDEPAPRAATPTAPRRGSDGPHLVGPGAVLAPIVRRVGWLLGPAGLAVTGLALAVVLAVILRDAGALVAGAVDHVPRWPWTVPVTVVIVIGQAVVHELAHGAAVVRWGGRCRSLTLAQRPLPGLCTDVSDVESVTGRRQRAGVFLAGIGTSWIIAAALLAAWTAAPQPSPLATALAGAGLLTAVLALVATLPWPGSDGARALAQLRGRDGR